MKIREKFVKMLYDNGLFEKEAEAVIEHYVNSPIGADMKECLNEDEANYPKPMMAVVWVGIKHSAVEWIDANHPQHWARAVFAQ